MVTVHGSQDCDAQATILWQRAFGSVVSTIKFVIQQEHRIGHHHRQLIYLHPGQI